MRNLNNPNNLEAGAIRRIATSSDGEVLKRFLHANLASADEENRVIEGADLHRSQGKALTIKAILDLLEAK